MKYVEQIKSFLLAFLVFLSVTLTLLIWNYKPDYELIEETQVEEVLISEPKQMQDVLRPYRVLYRQNDLFTGTVSNSALNDLYSHLITWQVAGLELIQSNISDEKMNEIVRKNNRATLFFNEGIPLQTFSNVLTFYDKDLPDSSFTRLIIDWSNIEEQNQLQLLFLNTEKRLLFRGYVDLESHRRFLSQIIEPAENYTAYTEVQRDLLHSLYVVQNPLEVMQYTYLVDELSIDSFKNIVFPNPSIVRPNVPNSEKYSDDVSWMQVDRQNRILNYVYPLAESVVPIPAPTLILDSFDYVNEHGGFTSDFRLSSVDIDKHLIEYQLFLKGYPVYSNSNVTLTRISTTWGENRLFRYRRPYYSIEGDVPNERLVKNLPSGEVIANYVRDSEDFNFKEVDEIVMVYHLIQNPGAYIFDPSWFVISNNVWKRITPEQLGGAPNGLE